MIITFLHNLNHWFSGHQSAAELFVVAIMLWPLWGTVAGIIILRHFARKKA